MYLYSTFISMVLWIFPESNETMYVHITILFFFFLVFLLGFPFCFKIISTKCIW